MADVVWEDPPPGEFRANRRREIDAVVAELRDHAGKWALVRTHQDGDLNNAWQSARPYQRRGCEAAVRRVGDERRVYARWPEDAS
jgi:hypothetical protein